MTRLKIQTVGFVVLAIWNIVTPVFSHAQVTPVLSASAGAFVVLALNNWKTIRREQEREKASRWD